MGENWPVVLSRANALVFVNRRVRWSTIDGHTTWEPEEPVFTFRLPDILEATYPLAICKVQILDTNRNLVPGLIGLDDFRGKTFSNLSLLKANFHRRDISQCVFVNCEMSGAEFLEAYLWKTEFINSNLTEARFEQCIANETCFEGSNLTSADFDDAEMQESQFRYSTLIDAMITDVDLCGAGFSNCDLSRSCFDKSFLRDATFNNCSIEHASFRMVWELRFLNQCKGRETAVINADLLKLNKKWGYKHPD